MSTVIEYARIDVHNPFIDEYVGVDGRFNVHYTGERPHSVELIGATTDVDVEIIDCIKESDKEEIEIKYLRDLVGC